MASEDLAAVPFFQHAIELDPNFALAYARLGVAYGNLDQSELSEKFLKEAFDRRTRASERERMYIESHYYCTTGQFENSAARLNLKEPASDALAVLATFLDSMTLTTAVMLPWELRYSPFEQLTAFRVRRYCVPICAIRQSLHLLASIVNSIQERDFAVGASKLSSRR